jgi:hypothetical protein
VLLGLAAALPTSVALVSELMFACAGKKGLLLRPGTVGLMARRTHREFERRIPWLSGVAAVASLGLVVSSGPMTRAGFLALGAVLALVAHLKLTAQLAKRFRDDTQGFERASATSVDVATIVGRWEPEMATRASLHAAALVCIVASMILS